MSILRLEPFIDGSFLKTSDASTDIDSPLTLKPYAQMVEASKQSVDLAVQSAQQAFLKHRRSTLAQRVEWLNAAAKGLEQALPELIDNLIPSPSLMSLYILWGPYTNIDKNIKFLNNLWKKQS
jgi:delta 1-pyrroline-5-carboxylate dehydrogenase